MKANELIRWFGINTAKEKVSNWSKENDFEFDLADLKRLVESHDLVESWGGLEDAKLYDLSHCKDPRSQGYKLKQAIADVESCQ